MNSEIFRVGQTYSFMGYDWTACDLVNDGKTLVIQSHGVTHGAWPGFVMPQFGNGHFYSKSIAGEDISGYDDKMQALYYAIKDTEDSFASYGKGLFLISKEKAGYVEFERTGSGNYWKVLQGVSMNYSPFGATCFSTWLGTVADANSGNAFSMDIGGCIGYSICNQPNEYAIAPAFNLDLSKVEIVGDEIVIRKSVKNARNTKKKKIREFLHEIYEESEILSENFGDEIVAELEERFLEDGYEITKKNTIEEMLWCYMHKMQ